MENKVINLSVANDVGNGFTKTAINKEVMAVQPSLVARVTTGNDSKYNQSRDINDIVNNIENELDITVQSNLDVQGEYLIGNSALISSNQLSFNINAMANKANSDISILMTLGMISIYFVKNYIKADSPLPKQSELHIDLATALPIVEWQSEEHQTILKKRYCDTTHIVTINNFAEPIILRINFDAKRTIIASEGVIGALALVYNTNGGYRNTDFYKDFIKEYNLPSFNGKNVQKLNHIIGIDIGDGTTDIAVTGENLRLLKNESKYIDMGIGNAIDESISILRNKSIVVKNRQTFLKQLLQDNKRGAYYQNVLNDQLPTFEKQISDRISTIFTELSGDVDLIYFHGAGANTIKASYQPMLAKLLKEIDKFESAKVLWLPQKYSQWLNLYGLEILANNFD